MGLESIGLNLDLDMGLDVLVVILALIALTMIALMAASVGNEADFGLPGKIVLFALFFALFVALCLGASNEALIMVSQAMQFLDNLR